MHMTLAMWQQIEQNGFLVRKLEHCVLFLLAYFLMWRLNEFSIGYPYDISRFRLCFNQKSTPFYCNQVVKYLFKNRYNQDDQITRSSKRSMFNNEYWDALNTLTEYFQLHFFVHACVVVSSEAPFQGLKCMVVFMFKCNKNPSTFNVIIKSLVLSAYLLSGYMFICCQP